MPIIFYNMSGCGYCVKAKKMFSEELKNGSMVLKPASEAPKGVRGFPTFVYNGKTQSGLPSSKDILYKKLGYINEGYEGLAKSSCSTSDICGPCQNGKPSVFFPYKGCEIGVL